MLESWTKTSSPCSREMKPKPLSALKTITVPVDKSSLSLVPGRPEWLAPVLLPRPRCARVHRSRDPTAQRSGALGLPAAAPSRAIGNRVFDGIASCRRHKWGSQLGRRHGLGRGHGLGWGHGFGRGHGLGWHRSRQLLLSLALRTQFHRYPSTVDSAMAGPRPLGADLVRVWRADARWVVAGARFRWPGCKPDCVRQTGRAWISGPINPTDCRTRRCPDRAGSAPCRLCRRRRGR
jgi:hypothetical protein